MCRVDLAAVRLAHSRIRDRIRRTPVVSSAALDRMAQAKLFFKCENLQQSGSFKIRGAANAVFSLRNEEAARGVVTHSSGNHAAALALAAKWRGIRAWIVMPRNAPRSKVQNVQQYGAEITFCEPTLQAREEAAAQLMLSTGAVLVHPFDDDRVIAGQGTAALEFLEEVGELDAICVPVSGGGLISGTAIAAQSVLPGIAVIGCEPVNADDAARSLASGELEPASAATTIADGLRATLAPRTLQVLKQRVTRIALVHEEQIADTASLLSAEWNTPVEPSSAVAAWPALAGQLNLRSGRIGIILTGGNVDAGGLPSLGLSAFGREGNLPE